MALYALIVNGNSIKEYRNFTEHQIPSHKSYLWRPVENQYPPEYDEFYHNLVGPTVSILEDKVVHSFAIENKQNSQLATLIKEEAARRIFQIYPLWKQYNMAVDKFTLMDTQNRTPEEESKLQEVTDSINWIKSIRLRSNELEAMNPIPKDFANDSYWVV